METVVGVVVSSLYSLKTLRSSKFKEFSLKFNKFKRVKLVEMCRIFVEFCLSYGTAFVDVVDLHVLLVNIV